MKNSNLKESTELITINDFAKACLPICTGLVTESKHIVCLGDVFKLKHHYVDCDYTHGKAIKWIETDFTAVVVFHDFEYKCYRTDMNHFFPLMYLLPAKFQYNIFDRSKVRE